MATVGIIHDTRVNKGRNSPSDGKFPIKLQIYISRGDQFPVSTAIKITKALKHLFNLAIDDKLVKADVKPFGVRKFVIGSTAHAKKNLTE